MSILSMILAFFVIAAVLIISFVGVVFFSEWAWYVISDLLKHHYHTL